MFVIEFFVALGGLFGGSEFGSVGLRVLKHCFEPLVCQEFLSVCVYFLEALISILCPCIYQRRLDGEGVVFFELRLLCSELKLNFILIFVVVFDHDIAGLSADYLF